ncbi:MAG: hypothetical protein ACM3ZB_12285 [bacterium]|jgi:hypothetical protein
MNVSRWRLAAAAAMVAALIAVAIIVTPAYTRNREFQRSLDAIVASHPEAADETLIAAVAGSAAKLGVPLEKSAVRVRRRPGSFQVEAPYAVRLSFVLFTLDLHFHPKARGTHP